MKNSVLVFWVVIFLSFVYNKDLQAQNDTMYIYQTSGDVLVVAINNIDSVMFHKPLPSTGTFIDARDSNTYKYVTIGNQIWMAENLKYLPTVYAIDANSNTDPMYYVYDYDGTIIAEAKATNNYNTYGVLYNWAAIMNGAEKSNSNPSGVQGVCPSGWHLPSNAEWTQLTDYLGNSVAGNLLKEKGTTHWISTNEDVTNQTGFTGLPGGIKYPTSFALKGSSGFFSSTSQINNIYYSHAFVLYNYGSDILMMEKEMSNGISVRCLKD